MGTPPTILAYTPAVHDQITRKIPQGTFHCKQGCQDFLKEVQKQADSRGVHGDKSNGRLYLHYMQPPEGYSSVVHQRVLEELGLKGKKSLASPDEFVQAAENRVFEFIAGILDQTQGKIDNLEAGRILYVLGTLLHAHQDRKHMEGNISDGKGDGISSSAHFSWDIHQSFSDLNPSEESRKRALERSVAFTQRFEQAMRTRVGAKATSEALRRIGEFQKDPQKKIEDYRPELEDWVTLFPSYRTRDQSEVRGHWLLKAGYFRQGDRNGFAAELGRQWSFPLCWARLNAGAGPSFALDDRGRSEFGLKTFLMISEPVDLIGVGVVGTGGIGSDGKPLWGVEGAVKLFEGSLLVQGGRFWSPDRPAENRFTLMLDTFALARSFEWISRDF